MTRILAAIDGQTNSDAAVDAAIWAAQRCDQALEFLHVLERPTGPAREADLSGALGADAQERLLHTLSEDDAQRSRRARERGRELLAAARARAATAGAPPADGRLRHGEVVQTVSELGANAALLVLGEHAHDAPDQMRRRHLDHHVERLIRAVRCPVLVATGAVFQPPRRVALTFDGSAAAARVLRAAVAHPLLNGLTLEVVSVTADGRPAAADAAESTLPGVPVTRLAGDPQHALPAYVREAGIGLLAIGGSRHGWLHRLVRGSTSSTLLRASDAAVLVLR